MGSRRRSRWTGLNRISPRSTYPEYNTLVHRPPPVPAKEAIMSAAPKPYITPEQYLERERQAEYKSEYFAGEIFAMAGASPEHNLISANVVGTLWSQLRNSPCTPYGGDQKVRSTPEH